MTDNTLAQIRSKGCEGTGLDEELARRVFDRGAGSRRLMAVVELNPVNVHGPDTEGTRKVDFTITMLEVSEDPAFEDHLRNLSRTLYYNRGLKSEEADGQLSLTSQSDVEPSVDEVLAAGKMHEPHEYIQAPDKPEGQGCDVCGKPGFAKVHTDPATVADPTEEQPTEDPSDHEEEPDPADAG